MSVPPTDLRPQKVEEINVANPSGTSQDSWILWPLLLPLILGASIILMQATGLSPNSSDMTPERIQFKPIHKPPAPTQAQAPIAAIQYSIPDQIWIVGDDAKLHPKPFHNNLPINSAADLPVIYTRWLNTVIAATPEMFPAGTHVQSVQLNGDAATINFNAEINVPSFWSSETKTKLAIYSIVNTLAPVMSGKGRSVPVQFLVDGKRLQTLGEFDVSEPIPPDYTLNNSARIARQNVEKNAGNSLP